MAVEEAILIFIKQCLRERRIPFEIRLDIPNQEDNFE
jgi:antitoxin component of RelBE/YafQ-DinJ toxin-antitoxin module